MNKRQLEVQKISVADEQRIIRQLKQVYSQASKDCAAKIQELSMRTDLENIQSIVYQKQYQEAIKKQIDGILNDLNSKSFANIADYLGQCYETGFIGTLYDLQGQGIPLCFPINQEDVVQALQVDSKISQGLYQRMGEDTDHLKKSIKAELSRGISNGSSWNMVAGKIASGMNSPFDKAYKRAVVIARTEGHRVQQQSTLHCQKRAKSKGADVLKQWDSTLDGVTRPTHRELDGQIREIDEPFEVAGMKAMYPGAFGNPAEDCNCRCCLLQRARWELDEDELNTLKERAEFFGLDKTKDFEDFKNKYLKAQESERVRGSVQKMNQEDTIDYAARRKERMAARNVQREMKPDFSEMSASEIRDYANNMLKTDFVGMKGANNDFIRSAVKVIDDFERKNSGTIEGLKVQFGGTPSEVYAKYDDKTNTLLLKKTGDIKAFEQKQIEDNIRYKFKWKTDTDYHATTSYAGTVAHELGHAVDFSTGQALSKALSSTDKLDELSVRISSYARSTQNVRVSKRSEAWAENFAAYMEGGQKAKEVPSEIVEMIEGYFKSKPLEKVGKTSTMESTIVKDAIDSGTVSKTINVNKQNRHIKDGDGYIEGRSYIKGTVEDAQRFVDVLSGTGTPIIDSKGNWTSKERVEASETLGVHISPNDNKETETQKATIVYSKTGSHIIPRKDE